MSTYGCLAHHGIKGQKWGVRRYENPDGSLTEAGKKRYRKYQNPDGSLTEEGKKRYSYSRARRINNTNTAANIVAPLGVVGTRIAGIALTPETGGAAIPVSIGVAAGIAATNLAVNAISRKKVSEIIRKSSDEEFRKILSDTRLQRRYDMEIAGRKVQNLEKNEEVNKNGKKER